MKTLTINYLSHHRLDSEKYWKITSHFLNLIEKKNLIKVNLLLSKDNNFENFLDSDIETEKHICNSYMEKMLISSNSNTPYSFKLDEDIFFSNHLFDKLIDISTEDSFDGVCWPLISLNTRLTDLFIKSFIDDGEVINNIHKDFLNVYFPKNLWNQKYSYIKLNKHTLLANEWNSDRYFNSLKNVKSKFKGIHPVRISYPGQLSINNYIIKNLSRIFRKYDYKLVEFENIYITSNAYMMKTEYFKKYLDIKPYDMFDEVQLNEFINDEKIKSYYIENGFAIHTMFNTVQGKDKVLNNPVSGRESRLEELYYVDKIWNYLENAK